MKLFLISLFLVIAASVQAQYTPQKDSVAAKPIYLGVNANALIQPNFVVTNWGFFCKQEWKFEKATKIPLKIRLGSLQATNLLEGYKQ